MTPLFVALGESRTSEQDRPPRERSERLAAGYSMDQGSPVVRSAELLPKAGLGLHEGSWKVL